MKLLFLIAAQLLRMAAADPTLLANMPEMQGYVASLQSEPVAGLDEVLNELSDARQPDPVAEVLANAIETRFGTIRNYESAWRDGIIDSLAAQQAIDSLMNLIESDRGALSDLSQQQAATWVTKYTALNSENTAVAASEVYELNWRTVNGILLEAMHTGYVPETSLPTLQSIAVQCPLAGGPAVYTARSLYAPFDAEISYDDVATCFESGYAFRPGKELPQQTATELTLQPNPARGEVIISLPDGFVGDVRLLTATGSVMQTFEAADKTVFTVSLENLPAGVYTCVAKAQAGETYTAKLVVLP